MAPHSRATLGLCGGPPDTPPGRAPARAVPPRRELHVSSTKPAAGGSARGDTCGPRPPQSSSAHRARFGSVLSRTPGPPAATQLCPSCSPSTPRAHTQQGRLDPAGSPRAHPAHPRAPSGRAAPPRQQRARPGEPQNGGGAAAPAAPGPPRSAPRAAPGPVPAGAARAALLRRWRLCPSLCAPRSCASEPSVLRAPPSLPPPSRPGLRSGRARWCRCRAAASPRCGGSQGQSGGQCTAKVSAGPGPGSAPGFAPGPAAPDAAGPGELRAGLGPAPRGPSLKSPLGTVRKIQNA